MTHVDPLGRILTEIRDDAAVAAITTRIRGGEPAGKTATDEGDVRGPGQWVPFVVLFRLGSSRLPHAPLQEVRIGARCYGRTFQEAAALAGAVSDAIHARGHRISGSGVVIFSSLDDGGGGAEADPDTRQPSESLVFSVGALTELLPIG